MSTSDISTIDGPLAEELSELADGSISLFVILPIFQRMLVSDSRAMALQRFEGLISEHLANLDSVLGDVLLRRDQCDGDLTKSLFRSVTHLRIRPESVARDHEILGVVHQAQLFLVGSCGFALRFATSAHADETVRVLQASLLILGSMIGQSAVPVSVSEVVQPRRRLVAGGHAVAFSPL
jgi:hypothetical protein